VKANYKHFALVVVFDFVEVLGPLLKFGVYLYFARKKYMKSFSSGSLPRELRSAPGQRNDSPVLPDSLPHFALPQPNSP